ncbi:MAG: hypothetical protein CVU39_28365 [Chloroflexi bacterium HGW-Chloroflexi-10]|nr:MAG: hypothetical protein CVU39_28365 [Chloroflexi bacterium HGW-Chloroflexi-10]
MLSSPSIALLPKLDGLGGPTSFQAKLIKSLNARGFRTTFNPQDSDVGALLVIGGTKHLAQIWQARRRGIRVVHRLNGMNWIHKKRRTGLMHYLRSEYGNLILSTIRKSMADHIIYQSQFARSWWQTSYGTTRASFNVVYNGVDLAVYNPNGPQQRPQDHLRVLLVEGHLGGGNEEGLFNAAQMVELLEHRLDQRVELMVAGDVPASLRARITTERKAWVTWAGVVKREDIPMLDRSAHLLFSADLNAACPNSVVEALACGLPVVAFATGSLSELVDHNAGQVAPYGANYWKLDPPDISALADAAQEILTRLPYFQQGARARAEAEFGLDQMVDAYMKALLPV